MSTPQTLFYPTMKLSDMIDANYHLLHVLSRMGISLGFGEISIEQMCQKHDISVQSFLIICNIYSFDNYIPEKDILYKTDISDIMTYLRSSHVYYSEKIIPRVRVKLSELSASCSPTHQKVLMRFFEDYHAEVLKHFEYEEKTVFPYIEQVLSHYNSTDYGISKFQRHHSDIDGKLNDLKSIIVKYLPENGSADIRNDVLFEIFLLEEDLAKHTLIENKILIPLVSKLEKDEKR
ncbi:MAG: hemerythrin domain-containing protein [Flavobacteriales bacterium]|nr:hemerythrin domain-containing protein [Flavobacteriales bacterium]